MGAADQMAEMYARRAAWKDAHPGTQAGPGGILGGLSQYEDLQQAGFPVRNDARDAITTGSMFDAAQHHYDPNAWRYQQGISDQYQGERARVAGLSDWQQYTPQMRAAAAQARAQQAGALGMMGRYATGEESAARQQAGLEQAGLAHRIAGQSAGRPFDPAAMRGGQMALASGAGDIAARSSLAAAQERQAAIGALASGSGAMRQGDQAQLGAEAQQEASLRAWQLQQDAAQQAWHKMGLGEKMGQMATQQDWNKLQTQQDQWNLSQGLRSAGHEQGGGTDWGALAAGAMSTMGGMAAMMSDERAKRDVRQDGVFFSPGQAKFGIVSDGIGGRTFSDPGASGAAVDAATAPVSTGPSIDDPSGPTAFKSGSIWYPPNPRMAPPGGGADWANPDAAANPHLNAAAGARGPTTAQDIAGQYGHSKIDKRVTPWAQPQARMDPRLIAAGSGAPSPGATPWASGAAAAARDTTLSSANPGWGAPLQSPGAAAAGPATSTQAPGSGAAPATGDVSQQLDPSGKPVPRQVTQTTWITSDEQAKEAESSGFMGLSSFFKAIGKRKPKSPIEAGPDATGSKSTVSTPWGVEQPGSDAGPGINNVETRSPTSAPAMQLGPDPTRGDITGGAAPIQPGSSGPGWWDQMEQESTPAMPAPSPAAGGGAGVMAGTGAMGAGIGSMMKAAMPYKPYQWSPINSIDPSPISVSPLDRMGAAALSDVSAKDQVSPVGGSIDDFLEKIKPTQFNYRPPFDQVYGPERRTGVIAQDVAASKLGAGMTTRDPNTGMLMLDTRPDKFNPLVLASLAHLNQRIDDLGDDEDKSGPKREATISQGADKPRWGAAMDKARRERQAQIDSLLPASLRGGR